MGEGGGLSIKHPPVAGRLEGGLQAIEARDEQERDEEQEEQDAEKRRRDHRPLPHKGGPVAENRGRSGRECQTARGRDTSANRRTRRIFLEKLSAVEVEVCQPPGLEQPILKKAHGGESRIPV